MQNEYFDIPNIIELKNIIKKIAMFIGKSLG